MSVFDLVGVERQEWNRILQDAPGELFVQADFHRIDFGKRRVRFTSLVDPNDPRYLSYQLVAIRTGGRPLVMVSQDAPPADRQVHANSVTYARSLSIKEIYAALDEGVEQIFLLEEPLALDGDLVIEGAFETDLPVVLASEWGGVLFLTGDSTAPNSWDQGIVYERAVVYDSAGRQMTAQTTAQHRRLIITIDRDWLSEATYPVVIDPLITIRDFNAQTQPAAAYNPSGQEYFVAWQDDRNYASTGWDIYAQRLSSEGLPEGDPIPIVTASGDQEQVAIAYNSNLDEYLVVWTDGRGKDDDIYGQRVSSGGTLIGPEIVISGARKDQDGPVIAYNSIDNEYLVAWDDNRSSKSPRGYDLFGARLAGTGEPIGSEISLCKERGDQMGPAVAYDSIDNEYLVTWADYRNGTWDIYAQRVAPDGGFPSSEFVVSDAPNDQAVPEIAYNNTDNQYLVAWRDNRSDPDLYGVYGRRVLGGDGPIGDEIAISVSQSPMVSLVYPNVSYNAVDNEYLVVWDLSTGNGVDRDIYGRRVSSGGTVQGDEFLVAAAVNDQMGPVAAHNGNDEYLVVWTDERYYDVTSYDIYGQRVANDGALEGFNFPISVSTAGQRHPGLAHNPTTNEYLVAWHDQDSPLTGKDIYAQLVFSSSYLKGDYFAVSTVAGDQEHATVAYGTVADEYLVVWSDGRNFATSEWDIYGQRISSAGVLTGTEIIVCSEIGAQQFPAVAYDGDLDEYLVVWQDSRATETDIYGQRITGAGVLTGTEISISTALGDQAQPVVAYNSAQVEYLVVWEDERAGAGNLDIYGQRVSSTGSLVGSEILISSAANDQASPAVAYNGATDEYLVVWHDFRDATSDADIYGQRISAVGLLLGSEIAISTEVEKQLDPAVDYDAADDRYMVVWQDGRNGASLTYDIYGQLVAGSGSLEEGYFPLSQRTNDEKTPSLAYNGTDGNLLMAWELWKSDSSDVNIFVDLPVPKDSFILIEEDLAAGLITIDDAALYEIYSLFEDEALPQKYRSGVPLDVHDGTAAFGAATRNWDLLDAATQQTIYDFFHARSIAATESVTVTGSIGVAVHHSTSPDDPCPIADTADENGNGDPDYVEAIGQGFLDGLGKAQALGYDLPLPWEDGFYHVVVTCGYILRGAPAVAPPPGLRMDLPHVVWVDNNIFTDDRPETPDKETYYFIRATMAHETFHVLQYEYMGLDPRNPFWTQPDVRWWMDATAVWFQDEVYPSAPENQFNHDQLKYYLDEPWKPLPRDVYCLPTMTCDPNRDPGAAYGAFIFAKYLVEKVARNRPEPEQDIVRETWETYDTWAGGSGEMIPAIQELLTVTYTTTLENEFPEFARENYFLNYDDEQRYRQRLPRSATDAGPETQKRLPTEAAPAEGPEPPVCPDPYAPPYVPCVEKEPQSIDHLGAVYVEFFDGALTLPPGNTVGMRLRVTVDITATMGLAQPDVRLLVVDDYAAYPQEEAVTEIPLSLEMVEDGHYRAIREVGGFGGQHHRVALIIANTWTDNSGDGMGYHYRAEVLPCEAPVVYAATRLNGIYYTEDFSGPGGGDPTWVQVNDGLGSLVTYSIVGDPFAPAYRQYTSTDERKIYRRVGGGNWSVILDSATVASVTGKTVTSGLEMVGPAGNINEEGHVYVVVRFTEGGVGQWLYLFKSVDYGDNWAAHVVSSHGIVWLNPRFLQVGVNQGSSAYPAGYVIYVGYVYNIYSDLGMRVSVDQGVTWSSTIYLSTCRPSGMNADLKVQSANQDVIYQVGKGAFLGGWEYTLRRSVDRGGSWSVLWPCAATPSWVRSPNIYHWEPLSAFIADGANGLRWTEDDWASHVLHTNADNFDVDGCSRVMDWPELLYGWQTNNPGGGDMQHVIAVSDDRGDNWEGKAGDDPVTPSATSIPNTCGGVAGIMIVQICTEE